ncbi:MAG: 3-hydroxybutyryl-CoA dehydrogenase [Thermoleophilia bacterium]|nr:3-hydroxybutyryl-CoA dehydrogenase [Thermoleophilia bacterium]
MTTTDAPSTEATTTSIAIPGSPADVRGVLVVGAGQMGSGIAQVFAQAGRRVLLADVSADQLERAKATITRSASKLHEKGKLDDDQLHGATEGITYVRDLDDVDLAGIQLAIEAATENEELKLRIFADLDQRMPRGAILATNTSSISITKIAAATRHPQHVVGMHFMNPVPVLKLVEVISGLETAPAATDLVMELARDLGKEPVHSKDVPGFIANRILMPLVNEAFFVLGEGIGDAEGIDTVMKLGMAHPMGPLALADLIGLDTCLAICEVLHDELGDPKYRPAPLLRQYVAAGRLGRKVGRGVYTY